MAVSVAFHYHFYKLFKRCSSTLPTLLPCVSTIHTLMAVPALRGNCNSSSVIFRTCKLQTWTTSVNVFACNYKESYNYRNPSHQNLQSCSSNYSSILGKIHNPYTVHPVCLNPSFITTPGLGSVIIRNSHAFSKFTIKNPVYLSYLESLVEEYDALCKNQHHSNSNTELQQQQVLRSSFLRPVVEVVKRLQGKHSEIVELFALSNGESDKEMKMMIDKEIEKLNEVIEELEEELVTVLVGQDPADQNDIVLEVSAGVGGQEAMLFTAEVLNMYCNYAYFKGWTITGITSDKSDIGGTRKATVEISGQDVYRHLKFEGGVHRVQRVPKTEKAGRIHTSTICVSVLPQPREIDIDIQQSDLKIEAFRSSGPGGQSVNTTDSAVRITHIPTGTVSECRQERSQIKNKEIAMTKLRNRMYQVVLDDQVNKWKTARKIQMGTSGRSEKIRTYNFQQDRITDHRLKESCSDLDVFMAGGERLDNLVGLLEGLEKVNSLESMLDAYETEIMRKKSGKS